MVISSWKHFDATWVSVCNEPGNINNLKINMSNKAGFKHAMPSRKRDKTYLSALSTMNMTALTPVQQVRQSTNEASEKKGEYRSSGEPNLL
jgi:hypothetical protein